MSEGLDARVFAPAEKAEEQDLYSPEWFKDRARTSLKKIEDGVWDFSDSLLLYVPGTEEEYEVIQQVENPYHQMVTKPERAYLEGIAGDLVAELPQEFEYVDLGPGTEHKEQFIFDAAKQQGKVIRYVPVDISEKFLALSAAYASEQGLLVSPQRTQFEGLAQALPSSDTSRFVSIGLTYSNYDPKTVLELLKSVAGKGGSAFVNSQIRDRVDMDEIRRIYKDEVIGISKSKLTLLGLDFDTDVSSVETDDGIRAWCILRNSTPELALLGIVPGTKLLMFQSLRTTKEKLENDVNEVFPEHKLLDTGEPFIGVLLKS